MQPIEPIVFALFALASVDAHERGTLPTVFAAALMGYLVEALFVTFAGGYSYGDFVAQVPTPGGPVPLWVALGWGAIIHVCMESTHRRTGIRRAAAAGLLAMLIDLGLDPVAQGLGWWDWGGRPGPYFGVPWDNFVGWVLIVGLFVGFRDALVARWGEPAALGSVPLTVAGMALATVGLELVAYPMLGEGCTLITLCFGLTALLAPASVHRIPMGALVLLTLYGALLVSAATGGFLDDRPEVLGVLILGAGVSLLGTADGRVSPCWEARQ